MSTHDPDALVTIAQKNGRRVGPVRVQGNGGVLKYRDRLRMALLIQRATNGQPLASVFEPKPGHVRVFIRHTHEDVDLAPVDLRGARLIAWERAEKPIITFERGVQIMKDGERMGFEPGLVRKGKP